MKLWSAALVALLALNGGCRATPAPREAAPKPWLNPANEPVYNCDQMSDYGQLPICQGNWTYARHGGPQCRELDLPDGGWQRCRL